MSLKNLIEEYKASLKSMDTEETIDLMFYRPIGFAWAKLAAAIGVTPNMITIASIFLGVAGGVLLYFHESLIWLNYVGIFLIIWANSFDSADGQLARMTKQYSRLGRILDGVSGDFWFVAIYVAIVLRVNCTSAFFMSDPWHPWLIWVMAALAGACHAQQAAIADYYRQFHLYFLKGKDGSELDSADALQKDFDALSWGKDFAKKFTSMFYLNYTKSQESLTPKMQALRAELRQRMGENITQRFRDDFRKRSLPLMKYTNMLSFNTRIIAMIVSVIIQMPWIYFAFELLVLNAMLVYMVLRHEHHCAALTCALKNGDYNE